MIMSIVLSLVKFQPPYLTDRNLLLEALAEEPLTVEQLAPIAGYEVSGYFRNTLSSLCKRGILGNNRPGYYVKSEYLQLLQEEIN